MDSAEEIVQVWLQQKGFFIMNSVNIGCHGKEADFLAVDPKRNKSVHVEVHASVFPLGQFRPWGPAKYGKLPLKDRVRLYYENKFIGLVDKKELSLTNRCIDEKVTNTLNTKKYEKWLVLGHLHDKDPEQEIVTEFSKHNVKIFFMRHILKEIRFKGTAKDSTGRFLQLLARELTDDSQKSLLKRK